MPWSAHPRTAVSFIQPIRSVCACPRCRTLKVIRCTTRAEPGRLTRWATGGARLGTKCKVSFVANSMCWHAVVKPSGCLVSNITPVF